MLRRQYSRRAIAIALGRAVSTIVDEINRNHVRGAYDPTKAQHKTYVRRHDASFRGKKIVAHTALRTFVESALSDGQSPEAIAGRVTHQERNLPYVSKDTIYRFLQSPYGRLSGERQKKKKRPRGCRKVTMLADRVFIDKRPKNIGKRRRVGDCEGDFIVSGKTGKGVLLTVVCRKFRVAFLELIPSVSIDAVHTAFVRIKKRFPEMQTLTLDNDILFAMHKVLEQLLHITIYFCHPYHSWEKGSIENMNKHIRKDIPKGSNLSQYDREDIAALEEKLNRRFLQCLNYATPEEVLRTYRKRFHHRKK